MSTLIPLNKTLFAIPCFGMYSDIMQFLYFSMLSEVPLINILAAACMFLVTFTNFLWTTYFFIMLTTFTNFCGRIIFSLCL